MLITAANYKEITLISLIRFFEKEEYLNDFLVGHLYMNSIGHFWALRQPNPQDDLFEGVFESVAASELARKYGIDFSGSFGSHIMLPVMNQLVGFQFVHILCFYMHEYDPELKMVTRIPTNIKSFGKYAIRIRDVQSFVDILFKKIRNENLYGLMGPITYRHPNGEIKYMDCFDKSITHMDEHEWRFALIPDFENAKNKAEELRCANANKAQEEIPLVYDQHIYFEVGDLRKLAEVVDVDKLMSDPGQTYGSGYKNVDRLPYKWADRKKLLEDYHKMGLPILYQAYPEQYVGWGPRVAFRDKVMEIDNGVKPLITIG